MIGHIFDTKFYYEWLYLPPQAYASYSIKTKYVTFWDNVTSAEASHGPFFILQARKAGNHTIIVVGIQQIQTVTELQYRNEKLLDT